jgi:type IX secretion system PorP/SprF family membrane protein
MKRLLYIFAAAALTTPSFAQDFHLSQYDAAALNVNPGMTGVFKGEYRIHAHYRNQWLAVATKPFTTGVVAFDANKGKWGFGGQIANFRAGVGGYNVISVMPSAACKFAFGGKKYSFISIGAQVGFFQKSINSSSLTFANQYVKTNGGEFNTALSTNESFGGNGILNLDVNAGIMYYYANPTTMINPFGGMAFHHINSPTESFLGESNKLPLRTEAIVGARIVITPNISVMPKVFYQYEKKASELTYAAQGQFYMPDYDLFLIAGFTYRNKDAAIVEFGAKYASFIARYSYDVNTSSLNNVSNGRGGSEISLTYIFSTPNPNPVPTCPRL